jgi:hypothetical protein
VQPSVVHNKQIQKTAVNAEIQSPQAPVEPTAQPTVQPPIVHNEQTPKTPVNAQIQPTQAPVEPTAQPAVQPPIVHNEQTPTAPVNVQTQPQTAQPTLFEPEKKVTIEQNENGMVSVSYKGQKVYENPFNQPEKDEKTVDTVKTNGTEKDTEKPVENSAEKTAENHEKTAKLAQLNAEIANPKPQPAVEVKQPKTPEKQACYANPVLANVKKNEPQRPKNELKIEKNLQKQEDSIAV